MPVIMKHLVGEFEMEYIQYLYPIKALNGCSQVLVGVLEIEELDSTGETESQKIGLRAVSSYLPIISLIKPEIFS